MNEKDVSRQNDESATKYHLVFENAGDVLALFDLNLNIIDVSKSVLEFHGVEPAEVLKLSIEEIMTADSALTVRKVLDEELKLEAEGIANPKRFRVLETMLRKKDGATFPAESCISFSRDQKGMAIGIVAVSRDITERKKAEEALQESEKRYRELSIIDDLTQLYNSRHFYYQLQIEIDRVNRYEQSLTLLFLDLDKFKQINDKYGHKEGDKVLLRFGQIIKQCLRNIDFAFRFGGEEFTIILPATTSASGFGIAERIRKELKNEIFSLSDQKVYVTTSIGIAQYKPGETAEDFVRRADKLMYKAKKNGRNMVCFEK